MISIVPLIVTILGIVVVAVFDLNNKCGLIVSSDFPSEFPSPQLPFVDYEIMLKLLPEAIKIALVSFSEGLLISK